MVTDLVTIGSAAWLGPHRPSKPRPQIPVLPIGFLWGKKDFLIQQSKRITKPNVYTNLHFKSNNSYIKIKFYDNGST